MTEPWRFRTDDGLTLEAEFSAPADGTQHRATAVLAHPHPLHGGTMQSIIISELFRVLPAAGVSCLRFNYRGVGNSEGTYGEGVGEQIDLRAAIDALLRATGSDLPLISVGWSFGADVTLTTADPRARAIIAITPPLRFAARFAHLAEDPRPKLVVLAGSDEVIDNAIPEAAMPTWPNTELCVVPGASHYFIGRTNRVCDAVIGFVDAHFAPR